MSNLSDSIELAKTLFWDKTTGSPPEAGLFILHQDRGSIASSVLTGRSSGDVFEVKPVEMQVVESKVYKLLRDSGKGYDSVRDLHLTIKAIHRMDELILGSETRPNTLRVGAKHDSPVFTYNLVDAIEEADTLVDCPAWESVLSRLTDSEAFAAWVYSVLEPSHKGRQLLYLYGPYGEEGKSIVAKALSRIVGRGASCTMSPRDFSSRSTFGLAQIEGKRLILVNDCSNQALLEMETVKCLTGGDSIRVEQKGKDARTIHGQYRMMTTSNYVPRAKYQFELSRLLLIRISKMEMHFPNLEDCLVEEASRFLSYGKHCYSKLCSQHYSIKSRSSDELVACGNEAEPDDNLHKLESMLIFGPNERMPVTDLKKFIKDAYPDAHTRADIQNILRQLGLKHGVHELIDSTSKQVRVRMNGRQIKVYRGVGVKPSVERIKRAGK